MHDYNNVIVYCIGGGRKFNAHLIEVQRALVALEGATAVWS